MYNNDKNQHHNINVAPGFIFNFLYFLSFFFFFIGIIPFFIFVFLYFFLFVYLWNTVSIYFLIYFVVVYGGTYFLQYYLKDKVFNNKYLIIFQTYILNKKVKEIVLNLLMIKILFVIVLLVFQLLFKVGYLECTNNILDDKKTAVILIGAGILCLGATAVAISSFKEAELNFKNLKEAERILLMYQRGEQPVDPYAFKTMYIPGIITPSKTVIKDDVNLEVDLVNNLPSSSSSSSSSVDSFDLKIVDECGEYKRNMPIEHYLKNSFEYKFPFKIGSIKDSNFLKGYSFEMDLEHISQIRLVCKNPLAVGVYYNPFNPFVANDKMNRYIYFLKPLDKEDVKQIVLSQYQNIMDFNLLMDSSSWSYKDLKPYSKLDPKSHPTFTKMFESITEDISQSNLEQIDRIEYVKSGLMHVILNINRHMHIIDSIKTDVSLKNLYYSHLDRDIETITHLVNRYMRDKWYDSANNRMFHNLIIYLDHLKKEYPSYGAFSEIMADLRLKEVEDFDSMKRIRSYSENDIKIVSRENLEFDRDKFELYVLNNNFTVISELPTKTINFIIDFLGASFSYFSIFKVLPRFSAVKNIEVPNRDLLYENVMGKEEEINKISNENLEVINKVLDEDLEEKIDNERNTNEFLYEGLKNLFDSYGDY